VVSIQIASNGEGMCKVWSVAPTNLRMTSKLSALVCTPEKLVGWQYEP